MKTVFVSRYEKPVSLDWNQPQLVGSSELRIIVLTSGQHTKKLFHGTVVSIADDVDTSLIGRHRKNWNKDQFLILSHKDVVLLQNNVDHIPMKIDKSLLF